jgi:predicted phage terminase large subunit-like protein
MSKSHKIKLYNLLKEKQKRKARSEHLAFIDYTWPFGKTKPLQVGFQTKVICNAVDEAMNNFRNGISSYVLVEVHPRAGKTMLISKGLPPHFLGEFPGEEVLSTSYSADLSATFSGEARNLVQSDKFKELYPETYMDVKNSARDNWKLYNKDGLVGSNKSSGILSGLNGRGASLALLDDHTASRADAESLVIRNKTWSSFNDDFMSRLAPVHIVFVIATSWHADDLNQRIRKAMIKDDDFPKFKVISLPAKAKDYKGPGEYPNEYLFMERYSAQWYRMKYATMGKYSAAALMDCQPKIKGGDILSTESIDWVDPDDPRVVGFKGQKWRVIDLAHTQKERGSDDPDYTAGTLLSFVPGTKEDPVPHLWVFHVYRCREGAVKRDSIIKKWARKDGQFVRQAIETSLDSKDAFQYLQKAIPDINWHKVNIHGKGDKLVRVTPLEPIFEAKKHVHVVRGSWNDEWLEEIESFTGSGKEHDDQIDNMSSGYIIAMGSGYSLTPEQRAALRARNKR